MKKDPYSGVARWYDKIFNSLNAGLVRKAIQLYPPVEQMSVLDIGCGTGSQLLAYQEAGCRLSGVDMSAAMLEVARDKLCPEADLHFQDASDLHFAGESFDLVTTTLVLHEMDPPVRSQVLREARRVLKRDGRILITDYHRVPLRFPRGWWIRVVSTLAEIAAGRRHYRNYRHFIRHGGLPELIAGQGLKLEQMKITGGGNLAQFLLSRESMVEMNN